MKKILAMILAISMVCSTMIFTGIAYADGTTVMYGQDFETKHFKDNVIVNTSVNKTETTNANYIYTGDKVISNRASNNTGGRIGDGLDANAFNIDYYGKIIKNYAYASFPAKKVMTLSDSADIYVDLDVYMHTTSAKMHLMLVDDDATALGATVNFQFAPYAYADLAISSDGTAALLSSYNATKTDASGLFPSAATMTYSSSFEFTTGEWHKVRFVLHNSSYDLYVDGNLIAETQSFPTGNFEVTKDDFTSLVIVTDSTNKTDGAYIGFDNIYMYQASETSAPANYARHLAKANEIIESIELAYSLGDITESEYANYIETLEEYLLVCIESIKTGAGEDDLAELEEIANYILNEITLTIPEGGLKYSNTYNDSGRRDEVYGIGNYWTDYTNNNAKTLYPHGKEAVFALNMKDADTVVKEGPNAGAVIEFDLKTNYLRETKSDLRLQVTDLVNTVDQGRKWFNVFIDGESGLVYKCYNGKTSENIASETYTTPFEDNKWYRVRIEIDVTDDASAFNGKQTMYIDGQPVFENTYTSTTAWGAFQELNGFQLVKDANETEGYGPMISVDNLSVFKYNKNSEKPVNKGKLIAAVRNAEYIKKTSKLYDDSTKNGKFTTELNKAIAAADAEDATNESLATALANINWYMTSGRTGMLTPDNKESYYINNFIWNDKDGNAAYEAEAGGSLSGIRITKNSPATVAGKVMIAQYDNDVLSGIETVVIPEMENGETKSLNLENALAVADNCSYKAFIWTDEAMLPVTDNEYSVVNTDKTGKKIFIIGDSIACNYNYEGEGNEYPQQGFGQALVNFFDSEKITIDNRAIGGYSTKRFIDNGNWAEVINDIEKGDYLIIAFGHNDQKTSEALNTYAFTTYRDNLERFVKEARAKGANPILMTSVPRALTTQNVPVGVPDHMEYPYVVKNVAEEYNVPLVDALTKVYNILSDAEYGIANAKRDMYLFIDPSDARYMADEAFATSKYLNGASDSTHLSIYGAQVVAEIICDTLKEMSHPLADYMEEFEPVKK